ncbi:hypothetical protein, partial [Mesorhizobium sp. LSJC280B00]|uniref:hypothetical protein n=1 Tax=Mesorhizobium sp. LSJC280B00 TaxID=1287336 RepID=UPI000565E347
IVGEGNGYAGFQPLAGDAGHFAGTTPGTIASSFRIGEQTTHFFKVAVTSHAMATTPQDRICFPSVAVWPRSQPWTPR